MVHDVELFGVKSDNIVYGQRKPTEGQWFHIEFPFNERGRGGF